MVWLFCRMNNFTKKSSFRKHDKTNGSGPYIWSPFKIEWIKLSREPALSAILCRTRCLSRFKALASSAHDWQSSQPFRHFWRDYNRASLLPRAVEKACRRKSFWKLGVDYCRWWFHRTAHLLKPWPTLRILDQIILRMITNRGVGHCPKYRYNEEIALHDG